MTDLSSQIRAYYDAVTEPVEVDALVAARGDRDRRPSGVMAIDVDDARLDWTATPQRPQRQPVGVVLISMAALVISVIALVVALRPADKVQVEPASPVTTLTELQGVVGPAEVLDRYEAAVNARDLDAVLSLYAQDAVLTGHPSGPRVAIGRDQIRQAENLLLARLANRTGQAFWLTGVKVRGNTAQVGHIWYSKDGCTAGGDDIVVVKGGLIVEWTRGTDGQPCVRELLDEVVAAFDLRLPNYLARLSHHDIVVTDHPDAGGLPIVGRAAVQEMMAAEFESLGDGETLELANIGVYGPEVVFDLIVRSPSGCRAVVGSRLVADGGRIDHWQWGTETGECRLIDEAGSPGN